MLKAHSDCCNKNSPCRMGAGDLSAEAPADVTQVGLGDDLVQAGGSRNRERGQFRI